MPEAPPDAHETRPGRGTGLVPLGEFVAALVDLEPVVDGAGQRLSLERLGLDLPVEIAVRHRGDGGVALEGGPPTQHVETTVLPVFHQLRIAFVRDDR